MSEPLTDPRHFTRAVTAFGEKHQVVTTRAIYNSKGTKIVEAGAAVNAALYDRLMQHQLDRPLQESVGSTPVVNGRVLRESAVSRLKSFSLFSDGNLDRETQDLLLDIVDRLPLPAPIAFQLTLAHDVMPELYEHLVLSGLVAAWLAMDTKVSRLRMSAAAAAGLLHDIGLLHLDPVLQDHRRNIDAGQRRQLFSHPLVSALLIEPHGEYGPEVARGVREHHEFLDGSGYPAGLGAKQIGPIGRILALTELIVGTLAPGREAAAQRLSVQLRLNTHRYEPALIEKVLRVPLPRHETCLPESELLPDPSGSLLAIDAALAAWPVELRQGANMTPHELSVFEYLGTRVSQLHRVLARAGVTPAQLGQLCTEALDLPMRTELTLLAREAAWQLGTLAREIRRQMGAYSGRQCPDGLKAWVERVDRVVTEINGAQARTATEQEPAPQAQV